MSGPSLKGAVLVYPEVERIFATKGPSSGALAGPYVHEFKTRPAMFGLPNGDLLITTRHDNPPRRRARRRATRRRR